MSLEIPSIAERWRHSRGLHGVWESQESRLLAAIVIGGAILSMQSDAFLTLRNLRSVLFGFSFVAIAALGQFPVILTGRIDLSAGSVMGLSGMASALALASGINPTLAIIWGVGIGALVGLINALFAVWFGISAFVVTLGTLQIARGVTMALTQGGTVTGFPDSFLSLGSMILGLPVATWVLIVLAAGLAAVLGFTGFGREIFAIGGNESAARLAGVAVERILIVVLILSGTAAGLAGVLMTARLGAAVGNAATGYELTIIASVVIGGTGLSGGKGSVAGVLLGAVLLALVNNALVLLYVPTYWQQAFIGAVLIGAALIDRYRR